MDKASAKGKKYDRIWVCYNVRIMTIINFSHDSINNKRITQRLQREKKIVVKHDPRRDGLLGARERERGGKNKKWKEESGKNDRKRERKKEERKALGG